MKLMKYVHGVVLVLALGLVPAFAGGAEAAEAAATPKWAMNATVIEACSCRMFCPCFFTTKPAAHHEHGGKAEHFCRFNAAYKVNKGHYGDVALDGALFWVAGDIGADFSELEADWANMTFSPAVSEPQREGIAAIFAHVNPLKWSSFSVAEDAEMEWKLGEGRAVARLDGGKTAEVVLGRPAGYDKTPEVHDLKYIAAPRNTDFMLMPNEVEAYRVGDKAFEFKGTTGFSVTFDITSEDVKVSPAS